MNLRRHGISSSNMQDQYDPKYASYEDDTAVIKAIFIHPVKSCGPIEVSSAVLTKIGFQYDRTFSFAVDIGPESLQFISQRTKPQMSLLRTELWLPHESSRTDDPLVQAGGCVVVTMPDQEPSTMLSRLQTIIARRSITAPPQYSFIIPLAPPQKLETKPFAIHHRTAHGLDMGKLPSVAEALPRLKRFLGYSNARKLTLFKCTPDTLSRTDRNLAPLANIGSPALHGYTDQQPININSVASVQALSALLPEENQPLNALRFRANLWISGTPAFEEDSWKRCQIVSSTAAAAPITLSVVCRTSRCPMTNVDPEQGVFTTQTPPEGKKMGKPQPTTTLVEHRTVENGNKAALGYIGMHAVPEDRDFVGSKEGLVVCVGDRIQVTERGVHLYGSTGNDY